jgi:glutamate formiminotransferase
MVEVLDVHSDPDHHRSVLTVAGPSSALAEAMVSATHQAATLIDLNHHKGVHPRLGAMDVVPFVPALDSSMKEAVGTAVTTARAIADRLEIPCFLYGEAAKSAERRSLPATRRMAFKEWAPDFGRKSPHPTAGSTVVGARGPLVAFNVNLATADAEVARQIAAEVREGGGGLPHVRAMGVELRSRGMVQVSMNLLRPKETKVSQAFEAVLRLAHQKRAQVIESEIVGLAPKEAISTWESMKLLSPPKILEEELARAFPG